MKHIAVLGDVMLDTYHEVIPTSEAPEGGPIYRIEHTRHRPGAAANLADCLETLGWSVHLIAPIGNDQTSSCLKAWAAACNIETHWNPIHPKDSIRHNVRYHSQKTCLLRADSANPSNVYWTEIPWDLLKTMDAIVLYDKGSLGEPAARLLTFAQKHSIRSYVDPSRYNTLYPEAYLLKSNHIELECFKHSSPETLKCQHHWTHLVCTQSGGDILHWDEQMQLHRYPVHKTDIQGDSIGAGDAFLAALITAEHEGVPWTDAMHKAALAGAETLKHIGTYAPQRSEIFL